MDVVQKINDMITPSLEALGYHIVLLKLSEGARRKTLTIMAERLDDTGMSFDDCTEISRTVSALLDVDDPIQGAYDLEVCSPGLDRPLTQLADYSKYAGLEAKCETFVPIDGRKRFRGTINGVRGDNILINMPDGEASIAFSNIRTAKLMMSEKLVGAPGKKKTDVGNKAGNKAGKKQKAS